LESFNLSQGILSIHLPRALVNGIQVCLTDILVNDSYADKAVANMLKQNTAWGSRDRKTATGIVYGITRNYLKYLYLIREHWGKEIADQPATLIPALITVTALSDDQLKSKVVLEGFSWKEQYVHNLPSEDLQYSIQKWIYNELLESWGTDTENILSWLDRPAPVYIRYNSLKTGLRKLTEELDRLGVNYSVPAEPDGVIRIEGANQLRQSRAFKEGLFEFQDIGSQYIVRETPVRPGQVVVDYCAGKGGKTIQLAARMKNEGRLIASDIDPARLSQLQRRAQKAGVQNLEISSPGQLRGQQILADVVLVDAPCTGSGTFRRQPDLKFRLTEHTLTEILPVQAQILKDAAQLLRPGGTLAYATCSLFRKENSDQIKNFLEHHQDFSLIKEEYILPGRLDGDGFYLALLKYQA